MAASPPQLTLQPIAAASWQMENSGMTTSSPSKVRPAIAKAAIFSASRWASGNHDPVASISPWQAIEVPVPNTGGPDVFRRVIASKKRCLFMALVPTNR